MASKELKELQALHKRICALGSNSFPAGARRAPGGANPSCATSHKALPQPRKKGNRKKMACSLRWMLQGMFLLVALVTVSFSLYLFNVTSLGGTMDDSITSMAFFSKETLHTQEVGIAANATMAIEIPLASDGVIADFSISGELAGRGSVKVYLKGDDARYLVLDSGDLVHNKTLFQQEAGELENESEQENETVLAQAEEDGQLKTKLGYGNDSLYDPDNDGLETYAGAIDFTVRNSTLPEGINASNLCTLYTIENTLQDDSTVVCHGSEMCCLLSGLHPIREAWDEPFYLTYQQYGAGEKNDITARIVYAYYQLDAVNQEAEFRVGEDATLTGSFFKDRVSFFDSCVATCQNIAINSSIIELEIEVQDSSISIEKIHYTTRKEVEIKELYFTEIPDLSIGQGTAKTINLSDYLLEKRGNVTFSFYEVEGIGISLEGEIATIRPLLNEQAEYFTFFRATDGNERATSNVVAITTEGLATTEALAGAGSLRSRAKAIIGEAVSHTAQLSANQSEISLPQAAQSISVAAIIGDEKIPVEKEEVTIHHKGSATSLADYASSAGSQQGQGQARARGRAGSAAAVEEADDSSEENITLQIADASEGHEVSYQTQAPIARERNISESKKEIIISAPDELGYEDVLAFTHLPIEVPESSVKLYLLVNGTRTEVAVDMFDTNNNSLIDYIEWLVPHLSEQAYELELAISEAAETTGAIASRRIGTAGANTWTFQEILGSEDMEIELVHIDDDDEHYIFAASIIEKQELPEDFTFDIAICDNIGEVDFKDNAGLKGKGKIKEKISASQSKKAIKKKARHNWCSETSNNAYMLEENAGKAEINNDYLIYIPKNESNFTIYAGSGTQVIIATVDTSAKGDSWNRKIVRDSAGTLHMVYSDANDDPIYVNSTDGGLTWSTPQVIGAASAGTVNLLIDSNDKMYAIWNTGGFRLDWATKPAGSPRSSLSIMPGFGGDLQDRFNSVDADISSTDTIHIAVTTTEFHDVTTHDFILYSNYTPEQGWYGDGTVVGFGDVVYNGTWILNDTAALAGGGFGTDIIVDSSDNVWVSTRQNTLGDTIVWKKAENGSWPNYQTLRTDNSGIGAMSASLNRDIVYAGYVAASAQLGFSNFTSASWDTNAATMVVDTQRTDSVSMLASSCPDESLYILYEDDTTGAGTMIVRFANSSDNGTTWTKSSIVTGLSANSIPSLRGSTWPAFNRLNGTIHYIYYNSSNQGLYFDTIDVPCPAVGGGDAISPSWRYNSTNVTATTTTNDMAEFGINWSDDVRLNYTIFSFDPGTGTWANDTPVGIENLSVVRNESKAITATVGQAIRWMWFANDTSGNMNQTDEWSFTVTTTAPRVENLSVTPAYPLNGSGVNVSANITSTGTISVAKILLHYPNGTNYVNYSLVSGGGNVYYNDSIIAGITPAGTYNVSIWVNDTAGNINNTVNGWFAPILNLTYEASITIDGLLDDWAGVSNYSDLVGDSNEPGGASTAVSSYDFSGIMYPSSTHNATYGYTALFPPEATVNVTSETEFNQTAAPNGNNYTNIIADDGAYASYQTASSGAYAIHKFVFEIDESEGEVIEINISVIGTAGESAPIAEVYTNEWYFYIYNLSMSNWSLLWHETSGDTSQFVQKYMNAYVLASTGDYIDNSKIYFISTTSIEGSPPVIGYSHVETDYANLSITYNAPEGDDFDIRRVALSNNGTSLFAFIDVNGSINYSDSTEYYRLFIDKNSSTGNTTTPESGSGIAVSYDFRVQVNASLCYVFNYTEEFTNISGCRIENGSNAIELDISMEDINVSGGDSINITFETGSGSQSYDFAPDYRSFLSYTFSNITSGETEPNVTLNAPIHLFNTSLSAVNFNWTVVDLDTGNLSCNLTIDDVINASDIIAENSTATNYTVTGFIGGSHNWSVACNDSSATNTSAVWSFFIVTGPTASNITIAANTSIITIAWPAVSGADSYNIFITDSWSGGV